MEKSPLGKGFMWLLLEPTDLSGSCQCSHLLPSVPVVSPFLFSNRGDPGSPPSLQWCWSDGEVQDGAITFPLPCPRLHIPTCPQPWAALPSISSSFPPALAGGQVLPGVQVTPLAWFRPMLVPGCLSPQMCCLGAGDLSAFKWGQVGIPQLRCRGINTQGLRAWLPLHNHLLSEPSSICIHPCIPPSTLGQFSAPLCPSSCCSSQRQTLHLIRPFLILFLKAVGFSPPLINFYLYLMRCKRPLLPSWAWGHSVLGSSGCFGHGWCGREGRQAGASALRGNSNPSLGGDRFGGSQGEG